MKVILEPYNEDVPSSASLRITNKECYLKINDCTDSIMLKFRKGSSGVRKLERLRVVLDALEEELTKIK